MDVVNYYRPVCLCLWDFRRMWILHFREYVRGTILHPSREGSYIFTSHTHRHPSVHILGEAGWNTCLHVFGKHIYLVKVYSGISELIPHKNRLIHTASLMDIEFNILNHSRRIPTTTCIAK